jgi:hypothetical protein
MPPKSTWLLQLPHIQETLEALDVTVVDRACFEKVFGVQRRRAIQLMHLFGGYLTGRTFIVERSKLLRALRQLARGDYEWELARRTKLVAEIDRAKKLQPGRRVRIAAEPEVVHHKLADLPAGVHLHAGELRIEFHGTEDLLRHLFELSQAIMNDYKKFDELCESSDVHNARHLNV